MWENKVKNFLPLFSDLDCVGHFCAYVANFVFLIDVWIRAQRDDVASRRASNLANHLPEFNHPSPPNLAIHLPNLAINLQIQTLRGTPICYTP
jgi:hypothetical protein